MSGQSIVDRLNAAKHTVAGSALGRAVVKATTEEVMGPKRKHLDCMIIFCYCFFFFFLITFTNDFTIQTNKNRFITMYIGNKCVNTTNG
jgi:hypothetical protein